MKRRAVALVLLAAGILAGPGAPVQIEKLLAFSGTNQVRVECDLQGAEPAADIELHGTIAHAVTGAKLWEGLLGKGIRAAPTITGLRPELWSPASPALYRLNVSARRQGALVAERSVRFGFRSFEIKDGQFHLNGQPIFLRGLAINPPGRGVPDSLGGSRQFAEDYVRFLKSQNVNIFRLSTDESQTWFDVCDELGMMLYAGRYGSPPESTKTAPPKNFDASIAGYKNLFEGYASHPSIVEYYLSNELPHSGARGAAFSEFLTRACEELKKWDSTRPYIGNAGYGEGREGDVCDVHRYWGWYYNSFLTYLNLRDRLFRRPLFGDPSKNQPITFTECVGSFTGSSGQFNLVRSKQLAPSLCWIGHTENLRDDALAYQAFMTSRACELFRVMRPQNPRLAGLMPFTILFYNWSGISSFAQMKPKPVVDAMRLAYQPVLLSWECWTPQVYAGTEFRATAHVVNDDDLKRELRDAVLEYRLVRKDTGAPAGPPMRLALPEVSYYGTWSQRLALNLPSTLTTGDYFLSGTLAVGGKLRSTNFTALFIAGTNWTHGPDTRSSSLRAVHLYDPQKKTASALTKLGVRFETVADLAALSQNVRTLILGEKADSQPGNETLRQLLSHGGRILCLQPDAKSFNTKWLPASISFFVSSPNDTDYPPRSRPFREQMNVNPERPNHPVFRGLNRKQLSLWSDYTGWDQTQPGFPKIYPVTAGFKLERAEALAHTAILADYDRGLEGIALCELFAPQQTGSSTGSVIVCGFELVSRIGLDPVADRLLKNLLAYTSSATAHEIHPLIERPIIWGDYSTEAGTVCSSMNGLLVNAEWVRAAANPKATALAPNTGAWNMLPGEQFEPRGRNPFGPYGYSTASSLKDLTPDADSGEGFFWARVPGETKTVVTTIANPASRPAHLQVSINDKRGTPVVIQAGQTIQVRESVPVNTSTVRIGYAGEKTLVLLQTEFQ